MTISMAAHADEALYAQARQLLSEEKNNEAYQLLEPQGLELAGESEYDYLLGLAALRSNRPEQAMLALERAVQLQPGYAAARMELVKAYLALGLDRDAQQQLQILETQQPPPAAREAMAEFQEVLRPRLSGTPDPVRLLGLSAGYDGNVGSYPDMGLELGSLLLTIEPVESSYSLLRGTWWQPVRLNDKRRLDVLVHGQLRDYQDEDADQFDLGLLHGGLLLNTRVDAVNSYALGLQLNRLWLEQVIFRDHLGASAYWQRRLGADIHGQLGVNIFSFRFEPGLNDYDMYRLSGELSRDWSPLLSTRLTLGVDYEKAQENRFGGDALRLNLAGKLNYSFNSSNQATLSLTWSQTNYVDEYRAGTIYNLEVDDKERNDNSLDLALGWNHTPAKAWQVDTDLSYRQQDSTVRFYDVERWTAELTVLRYF